MKAFIIVIGFQVFVTATAQLVVMPNAHDARSVHFKPPIYYIPHATTKGKLYNFRTLPSSVNNYYAYTKTASNVQNEPFPTNDAHPTEDLKTAAKGADSVSNDQGDQYALWDKTNQRYISIEANMPPELREQMKAKLLSLLTEDPEKYNLDMNKNTLENILDQFINYYSIRRPGSGASTPQNANDVRVLFENFLENYFSSNKKIEIAKPEDQTHITEISEPVPVSGDDGNIGEVNKFGLSGESNPTATEVNENLETASHPTPEAQARQENPREPLPTPLPGTKPEHGEARVLHANRNQTTERRYGLLVDSFKKRFCPKLDPNLLSILTFLKSLTHAEQLSDEMENLESLFKHIWNFTEKYQSTAGPITFNAIVKEIGSTLNRRFVDSDTMDPAKMEILISQRILIQFENVALKGLADELKSTTNRDLTSAILKLSELLRVVESSLEMARISREVINGAMKQAVQMSLPVVSYYAILKCKNKTYAEIVRNLKRDFEIDFNVMDLN